MSASPSGWFKAVRSEVGFELIKLNPNAFVLLYVIAFRARWHDGFNAKGLTIGQAFLGDHKNYGMSERQYRTAKQVLETHRFATFKATSKGTVSTITDSRVWELFEGQADGQSDGQPTDSRRTSDGQPTDSRRLTKKERTKEGKSERAEQEDMSGKPDELPMDLPALEPIPKKTLRMQKARPLLHYLNEKAGKHHRETEFNLTTIAARLAEVGDDIEGCKAMIDRQCALWGGDAYWRKFLRIETLFGKEKFGGYYDDRNEPTATVGASAQRNPSVADTRNQFIAGADDPERERARLEAGRLAEARGLQQAVDHEPPKEEQPFIPAEGAWDELRAAIEG